MAGGFKSQSLPHLKYYSDQITLPSMHIFGDTDKIIPTGTHCITHKLGLCPQLFEIVEMSEALSTCFEDPKVVRHPGGHYLPAAAPQKHDYQSFFKLQLLQKQYREQMAEGNTDDQS